MGMVLIILITHRQLKIGGSSINLEKRKRDREVSTGGAAASPFFGECGDSEEFLLSLC